MPKVHFTSDFSQFVDDLGSFLWNWKDVHGQTWKEMAKDCHLTATTLVRLADGVTQNPQLYTCWKILRSLDHASVIRHSQLERYRGIGRPMKKAA
jgi:DNA-binding XRE family transcriptional regulator